MTIACLLLMAHPDNLVDEQGLQRARRLAVAG